MPIIDPTINQPVEPTLAEKQTRVSRRIKQKSTETLFGLIGTYTELMQTVWQNPAGLSPQQVFEGLGTDASQLFSLATVLVTTVNTVQPGTLVDAHPYNYTINEDGTVTVGDPVVAPE